MATDSPTLDELRDRYLLNLLVEIPGAKTKEGSDHYARAVALANVLAPIYANGDRLEAEALPTTASEEGLLKLGRKYGVARRQATAATGTVTVTSSFATTIGAGTKINNVVTGARYKTIGTTTIGASLSATANVVAIDTGTLGNATSGTVLTFESAPAGINPSAIVQSISGGEAAWSKTKWAQEIARKMKQRAAAGNVDHIYALAHAIPGVEQAFVYPALRGCGTNDVIITTSAASGTRVAGTSIINRVIGALQLGVQTDGGDFVAGLDASDFANTRVSAAIEQSVTLTIGYKASPQNPFASWPPQGSSGVQLSNTSTWYVITAASALTSFTVGLPGAGTVVSPAVGNQIGLYFASKGFCKATIATVSGTGPWTVTASAWVASDGSAPTDDSADMVGLPITPWCSQLVGIAGAPSADSGQALTGAAPEYFAGLGPGEMTALTADDLSRRCRWPHVGEVNVFDATALWPTDVTARLSLSAKTDAANFTISASPSTPDVPNAAFIGTPPSILVLGAIKVIPQ